MPFWQLVQKCATCLHWKNDDTDDVRAYCGAPRPLRMPFFADTPSQITTWNEGANCPAYTHGKNKPHPLNEAPGTLTGLMEGDVIGMRTYRHGETISRGEARVLRVTGTQVSIMFMNTRYRMRRFATERIRAGTLMEMSDWGIDMEASVQRAARPIEHMHMAAERLANVSKGAKLTLLGYPPFDGQTKTTFVLATHPDSLTIRSGHGPKQRLYRIGPLAGMIANDPCWVLDTRQE